MIKFIEVNRIYDYGSSFERHSKLIINVNSIKLIEDVNDATVIELNDDIFFVVETYEEIKAILEVINNES